MTAPSERPVLGIDGCPAGWFWWQHEGDQAEWGVSARLRDLLPRIMASRLALIDIPIGLVAQGPDERRCDLEARRLLGRPRASSVFRPPCRAALNAGDYRGACRLNRERTGKGLSKQTWNILPKIREADTLLREKIEARGRLREAHPELVLWALNGGAPMQHNKKLEAGFEERCALLGAISPGSLEHVQRALAGHPRRGLARDDAVDALALALGAQQALEQGGAAVCEPAAFDTLGIPMEMVFPLQIKKS